MSPLLGALLGALAALGVLLGLAALALAGVWWVFSDNEGLKAAIVIAAVLAFGAWIGWRVAQQESVAESSQTIEGGTDGQTI